MQRFAWSLACVLGLLAGLPSGTDAGWETDFEKAKSLAEESGRPLLIHFYADWCGPCQQMESTVLNTSSVEDVCGTACIAVKVNLDHHEAIAKEHGVAALPTDVIVGPDGKEISRNVGKASVDEYIARMQSAAREYEAFSPKDDLPGQVAELLMQLASEKGVGLQGYSPVALTKDRVWTKGTPEFAWRHGGVMYHLADAAELEEFKADPAKFAPQLSGFDPLILSMDETPVEGQIVYGSFYQERLYLHATAESRTRFLKDPAAYPVPEKLDLPEAVVKREPVVAEIPAI